MNSKDRTQFVPLAIVTEATFQTPEAINIFLPRVPIKEYLNCAYTKNSMLRMC